MSSGDTTAPNPRFFSKPVAIFLVDVKQARLDPVLIQQFIYLPSLRERWCRTNQISAAADAEFDWNLLDRAMHYLQAGIQRWTTKHTVSMLCGAGKFVKVWVTKILLPARFAESLRTTYMFTAARRRLLYLNGSTASTCILLSDPNGSLGPKDYLKVAFQTSGLLSKHNTFRRLKAANQPYCGPPG
ncbi:MAG: hypothetical protein SGBAC_005728 [Bacillariaceae sp.]